MIINVSGQKNGITGPAKGKTIVLGPGTGFVGRWRPEEQRNEEFAIFTKEIKVTNIMALEQQIQEDIKAAMKAHDAVATAATRAIKGEILLFKTSEGGSKEVTDGDILKMIQKLIKQRKEAAEQFVAAGRQELADNELAEAAVMEKYLPKQLSEAEVEEKVKAIIAETGATSIKDMGKVMGAANKALAGQSDGRTISTIVKKLLS